MQNIYNGAEGNCHQHEQCFELAKFGSEMSKLELRQKVAASPSDSREELREGLAQKKTNADFIEVFFRKENFNWLELLFEFAFISHDFNAVPTK